MNLCNLSYLKNICFNVNMKRSICGWYQILQRKQNIKASYRFSTFIPRGGEEGYSFLSRSRKALMRGFILSLNLDKYNTACACVQL